MQCSASTMAITNRGTSLLVLLSAIVAALLSSQLVFQHPPCLEWLLNLDFLSFTSSISLNSYGSGHHRRHRAPKTNDTDICDDLPPGFPPADTDTTSIFCVDRNGCCSFTTVQSAVDAVAVLSQKRSIVWINKGIYYEKVTIPKTKPNITFQGQGLYTTGIAWNDTANSSHGTFYSASVAVFGANFIAKNISFINVAPIPNPGDVGAQAVAIRVSADQAAFWGCGFFGAQDTLHDDRGRHYFKECHIQGSIDFIFGDGRSLYESCQMISIASPVAAGLKTIDGTVTAHGRASGDENTGFSFVNCSIGGTGRIWLGRAWRPFSRVVFANTFMSEIIAPEGWNDFGDPGRDQTVFYGEYNCSGAGASLTTRVPYAQKLNDTQAAPFLNTSFIDGDQWLQPLDSNLLF
ncbi:probable pectinesterase 8 [Musa acuminata AAA Group]|uniref:probable pectinesterase 8 n=1 Tax=Musa acuminata AAA Group TaxID=214697 RepID=UPI0031DE48C8